MPLDDLAAETVGVAVVIGVWKFDGEPGADGGAPNPTGAAGAV